MFVPCSQQSATRTSVEPDAASPQMNRILLSSCYPHTYDLVSIMTQSCQFL
jgi:hypothetical protein